MAAAVGAPPFTVSIASLHTNIEDTQRAAWHSLHKAREATKATHDAAAKPVEFSVGDYVLANRSHRDNKLHSYYEGPYLVLRRHHGDVYEIRSLIDEVDILMHARRLLPFNMQRSSVEAELDRHRDPERHFYVEAIKGHRRTPKGWEFLVKYRDFPDPSWQPASDLRKLTAFKQYCEAMKLPKSV